MGFSQHLASMGLSPVPTQEMELVEKDVSDSRATSVASRARMGSMGRVGEYGLPLPQDYEKFLGVYANSVWVYSAVWIIATNASSVPMYVVDNRGEDDAKTIDVPGLERPNELMTMTDLREATHVSLELIGMNYLEIVGDELYWIRPDKMKPIPHERRFIKGYVLHDNGVEEKFKPEEIIAFRSFNPIDPYYGLAPMAPSRLSVDSDYDGRYLFRKFFENAAIPAGVLETDYPYIGDKLREQLREEMKNLYQGLHKAFSPMIFPAGLKWREIQVRPQDLSMIAFNQMSREEILGAFRVPPILVGLEAQNFATAREQKLTFWQNNLMPKMNKFSQVIGLQYLDRIYGDKVGLKLKFDYSGIAPLQDAWKELGEFVVSLKRAGILSANEARIIVNSFLTALDLGVFPEGNTIYGPLSDMPVGRAEDPRTDISVAANRSRAMGLASVLKRLDRFVEREQYSKRRVIREQMLGMLQQARREDKTLAGWDHGWDGNDAAYLTQDYEEHRMAVSIKYRERRDRNPVLFTQAGSTHLYQAVHSRAGRY